MYPFPGGYLFQDDIREFVPNLVVFRNSLLRRDLEETFRRLDEDASGQVQLGPNVGWRLVFEAMMEARLMGVVPSTFQVVYSMM